MLRTFQLTGGNYRTLTASVSDTFGNTLSPVECSFVCFGVCNTCVKLTKVAHFKMAAHRVNICYLAMETVELVLNEGSALEDFLDSGSEENIVDSGEEFVPVDLEADLRDSDNNIFIFIIGIRATSRIKLHFFTVFGQFPLCCWDRERYMIWRYGLLIWQVHIPSFLKMYMFIVLFLVVYLLRFLLNGQKQCVYRSWACHFVASWMS